MELLPECCLCVSVLLQAAVAAELLVLAMLRVFVVMWHHAFAADKCVFAQLAFSAAIGKHGL